MAGRRAIALKRWLAMTTSSDPQHLNLRPRQGDYHDTTQSAFAHRPDRAKLPWHRPKPICLVVSLTLWSFQSGSKKWMLSYCRAMAAFCHERAKSGRDGLAQGGRPLRRVYFLPARLIRSHLRKSPPITPCTAPPMTPIGPPTTRVWWTRPAPRRRS